MNAINERERYNRQQLIGGWDQQKLSDAKVTIIGSDYLAQYCAIPLVALGVGRVRLVDEAPAKGEHFLDFTIQRGTRVGSLEQILGHVNSSIKVFGIASPIVADTSRYFLEQSDLIVEATNDPRSKAIVIDYAHEKSIPVLSGSTKANYGKVMLYHRQGHDVRYLLPEFEGQAQDEIVSLVLGGIIAEEVKKVIMGDEHKLDRTLYYNLTNPQRFTFQPGDFARGQAVQNQAPLAEKSVLMVGAGALGNFVGMGLAKLGVGRVDVIDPDRIEDTNLNRQVLYYNVVGRLKATALAKKLKRIGNGNMESEGFADTFTEKKEFERHYDLIMDCVDNFTVRAVIHDYAVQHKIPLISGGTDYKDGQMVLYVPGKTACVDCQLDIHAEGRKAVEERRQAGCLLAPNPSVITTNQIIGGMMVAEARTVFDPGGYGSPFNGKIMYRSQAAERVGMTALKKICACEPKGGLSIEPREIPTEQNDDDLLETLAGEWVRDEPVLPEPEETVRKMPDDDIDALLQMPVTPRKGPFDRFRGF